MQYPLVSAIVLCYNHAKYVTECLEAVKSQRYPNLELLINDDASQDDSASVIRAWLATADIPHRFLRSQTNQGLCRSLNGALKCARGKYISGIAADDAWLPEKLLAQVRLMEELPRKVGVVYSDALRIDEYGRELPQRFISAYRQFTEMPQGNVQQDLWNGNFIPAMTTLVRRECYDTVGLFDETLFYEDWDMWLRISRCFDFVYSSEVSAKYRIVATSMMQKHKSRILDAGCQVCIKHIRDGKLNSEALRAAICMLRNTAIATFSCKTPRCRYNLLQALRYTGCPQVGIRLLFIWCGLGPSQFERVRKLVWKRSDDILR